ncbi:DoxX family protein [Roseateles koreensis]|uniref:DoxX family protein n=1 Tax=Roseateles koreensis TaxID=2987526 RepID=A0ABT5KNJ5_9BURK|nr:DoxX family protein [Roseateles koreensis]MDC8784464.1 DoxX family protein [Roseateles koreensis]
MKNILCAIGRFFVDPGLHHPADSRLAAWIRAVLGQAQSLALLLARWYVARVFFLSGLTKIHDWQSTLALFADEYQVPLLPPELAAYLGTGGELGLPVLLCLGAGGRFAALGLSVVNLVAVLSLSDIAPAALAGHQLWGVLLLSVALWGAGRWSVDAWLQRVKT